jgi:hypothetical protein
MARELANVILDRVIEARDLEDAAIARAERTRTRVAGLAGKLSRAPDPDAAEALFVQSFRDFVLAELLRSAPEAFALARKHLAAEARAVLAVGVSELRTMPALTKPDVMARLAERRGA